MSRPARIGIGLAATVAWLSVVYSFDMSPAVAFLGGYLVGSLAAMFIFWGEQ